MRQFVQSLRRLYLNQRITAEKVHSLYNSKTISEAERDYILQAD